MSFWKYFCCFSSTSEEDDPWAHPDWDDTPTQSGFCSFLTTLCQRIRTTEPEDHWEDYSSCETESRREEEADENEGSANKAESLSLFDWNIIRKGHRDNQEKRLKASLSYLSLAEEHLKYARDHLRRGEFSPSVLQAQMSAEKALKALYSHEHGFCRLQRGFHSHYLLEILGYGESCLSEATYFEVFHAARNLDQSVPFAPNLSIGSRYPKIVGDQVELKTLGRNFFTEQNSSDIYVWAKTIYSSVFNVFFSFLEQKVTTEDYIFCTENDSIKVTRDGATILVVNESVPVDYFKVSYIS